MYKVIISAKEKKIISKKKKTFNIFLSGIVKFFKNGLFLNMQIDLPSSLGNKISITYKDYWGRKKDLSAN